MLVLHAFDLACPNGQPPSAYVKSYLQPDTSRLTKRKTRVIKRTQHPTFMEMVTNFDGLLFCQFFETNNYFHTPDRVQTAIGCSASENSPVIRMASRPTARKQFPGGRIHPIKRISSRERDY